MKRNKSNLKTKVLRYSQINEHNYSILYIKSTKWEFMRLKYNRFPFPLKKMSKPHIL